MTTIKYSIKYRKNEGLVMSPQELLTLYFYGISIQSRDGTQLSYDTIKYNIKVAQEEVEKFLEIRLNIKFIEQTCDYFRDDYWNKFPIIRTKLPVRKPLSLVGLLNGIEQIRYPNDWLSCKKDNEEMYFKKIHIIPTGSISGSSGSVLLSGITAYYGMTSFNDIPNYFTVQYLTGFSVEHTPTDIIDLIGKYAAIRLFHIAGDIVLGQGGLTSISLGVDGLSQSISTAANSSGSAYGARIKGYLADVDVYLKRLKNFYKGINFTSL
jgi:hypothetical protein